MGSLEPSSRPDPEDRFRHALMRSDGHAAIARAEAVLRRFGASVESAQNPRSASNDVWLAGEFCLRMSRRAGPDSLSDEVRLAALLPPEVGYPEVIATGVEDGHQWVLSRRLPGLNLWDAWPALTHDQRMIAVEELWQRHVALQRVDLDLLADLQLPPPRRYHFDRDVAARQLRNLVEAGVLEGDLASSIWEVIERGLEAVRAVPWRLVHGDPGLTNAQCHGDPGLTNAQCHDGNVVGLLDLEAAAIAPIDVDLDPLLRMLADPLDDPDSPGPHGMPDAESFVGAFERLVTVAAPFLQLPGAPERFRGYAALADLTVLEGALRRGMPIEILRGWTVRVSDVTTHRSYLERIWS